MRPELDASRPYPPKSIHSPWPGWSRACPSLSFPRSSGPSPIFYGATTGSPSTDASSFPSLSCAVSTVFSSRRRTPCFTRRKEDEGRSQPRSLHAPRSGCGLLQRIHPGHAPADRRPGHHRPKPLVLCRGLLAHELTRWMPPIQRRLVWHAGFIGTEWRAHGSRRRLTCWRSIRRRAASGSAPWGLRGRVHTPEVRRGRG